MKRPLLTLSLSLFLALSLGRGGAAAQGTLVIVGGGLDPDNEAVYRAVLDRMPEDGTLGVLPTASGVPEESGPLTVQDFEQYSGPEQKIELIDLRNGEVDKANDPAWAQRIAACDALWFTGGDQARIVSTFRVEPVGDANPELEDGPDSLCYEAVIGVFRGGGVVGGTSAGAAMMSDPMILWGNSHEALLVGVVSDVPDFGVGLARGMGIFPVGMIDQHFLERQRLGRLLAAVPPTGNDVGYGIAENTALVLDNQAEPPISVVGETGVLRVVGMPAAAVAHVAGKTPAFAFLASYLPAGATERDGRAPTVEEIRGWIAGAPNAYDGPPAFDVERVGPVVQNERHAMFMLLENADTARLRSEAEAQLAEARE